MSHNMMIKNTRYFLKVTLSVFVLLILVFFINTTADAQTQVDVGIFDTIFKSFFAKTSAWKDVFLNAAKILFVSLSAISLVWTFVQMAVKGGEIADFFFEFIRFIIVFGFFYWILINGADIAVSFIKSFSKLGSSATGNAAMAAGQTDITPSGIVNIGFVIFGMTISNMSILPWNMAESLLSGLIGLGCLIVMTIIAVNYLLLMCSAWIVIYAGIFTLGFGGSSWTRDIAINYFKHVLSIGLQIMTMILIVGIGMDLVQEFYDAKPEKAFQNIQLLGLLLATMLVVAGVALKVPPILGGLITGSSVGNGGASMGFAAAAAAGGMAFGAAAGVAAQGAGGLQAIKAAFNATGGSKWSGASESGAVSLTNSPMLSSAASSMLGVADGASSNFNQMDSSAFAKSDSPDASVPDSEKSDSNSTGFSSGSQSDSPSKENEGNQNKSFTRRVVQTAGILASQSGKAASKSIQNSTRNTVGGKMARVIRASSNAAKKEES